MGARSRDGRELFLERRRHFRKVSLSRQALGYDSGDAMSHETQRDSVEFVVADWLKA